MKEYKIEIVAKSGYSKEKASSEQTSGNISKLEKMFKSLIKDNIDIYGEKRAKNLVKLVKDKGIQYLVEKDPDENMYEATTFLNRSRLNGMGKTTKEAIKNANK